MLCKGFSGAGATRQRFYSAEHCDHPPNVLCVLNLNRDSNAHRISPKIARVQDCGAHSAPAVRARSHNASNPWLEYIASASFRSLVAKRRELKKDLSTEPGSRGS